MKTYFDNQCKQRKITPEPHLLAEFILKASEYLTHWKTLERACFCAFYDVMIKGNRDE